MSARNRTAIVAKSFRSGDSLYQQRGRKAFPILVRQAVARKPITYGALAKELGMPNARNLNYVLGSVGQALVEHGQAIGKKVPPLSCLVLNEATGIPGEGVGWFIKASDFKKLNRTDKKAVVDAELQKIYLYQGWEDLLREFALNPAASDYRPLVKLAACGGRGGGESAEHRALKEALARHPEWIGLPARTPVGQMERPLPSADVIDVYFEHRGQHIAVEVKSRISDDTDLVRGLYQCVKYEALLKAEMAADGLRQNVRTCLLTARPLPEPLKRLRTVLGVEVIVAPAAGGGGAAS